MDDYVDQMVEAFIAALLWAGLSDVLEEGQEEGGNTMSFEDAGYDADDIHPDALAEIEHDCAEFYEHNANILNWIRTRHRSGGSSTGFYNAEMAGHDFYLTREGHGVGFWDRGLGMVGDILTHEAKCYGSVDAYVGDDGKIYV